VHGRDEIVSKERLALDVASTELDRCNSVVRGAVPGHNEYGRFNGGGGETLEDGQAGDVREVQIEQNSVIPAPQGKTQPVIAGRGALDAESIETQQRNRHVFRKNLVIDPQDLRRSAGPVRTLRGGLV
jgi:hypothetical protein